MKKAIAVVGAVLVAMIVLGTMTDEASDSSDGAPTREEAIAAWDEGPPDGSYLFVERRVKAAAHEPGSIEIGPGDCRRVGKIAVEGETHGWSLECAYRGKNALGATVRQQGRFAVFMDTTQGSVGYFAVPAGQ